MGDIEPSWPSCFHFPQIPSFENSIISDYCLLILLVWALPVCLNVECVRLINLVVVSWIPASGELAFRRIFASPLSSAESCEESSQWLWKEKLC